ncbi:chorismate-binding protein, partial [Gemmatimonas sp.]|uniref:chorismate-binding protein n=1 Tax=Gemmatimonas sp. TaxID=1962908 RepID=UPI0037C0480F
MTTSAEFRARAKSCRAAGGLVPVWRDCLLDLCTPVSAYAKLRRGPFAFLLESAVTRGQAWSRYTYLGTEPRGAWRLKDGVVEDWTAERGWYGARTPADPIADLRDLVRGMNPVDAPELDALWGGAFGFFSYDTVRHIEHLPDAPPRVLDYPDACFVFTDTLVVIDNWRGQARVIASVPVPAGANDDVLGALFARADASLDDTIARLQGPEVLPPLQLHHDAAPAVARSTYERDAFLHDVARIKEYILAGDVFQALLARRMETPLDFDTTTLYRTLRALNPSPYMFHLQLDGLELVGSSPEMMLRVADGKLTVRPIAGTRPRGRTEAEDQALADELI